MDAHTFRSTLRGSRAPRLAAGLALVLAAGSVASAQTVWHVSADASCDGDGLTWASAFCDLQDALDVAVSDDDIWVTGGIYSPDRGTGDRSASFQLVDGVRMYGGFEGTEDSLDERVDVGFPTLLSGDLLQNDVINGGGCDASIANREDNSLHVVRAEGVGPGTMMNQFIITSGSADGTFPDDRGAGIYCDGATLEYVGGAITLCVASTGSGMMMTDSDVRLVSFGFFANHSIEGGAAAIMVGAQSSIDYVNGMITWNSHVGGNSEAGGFYVSGDASAVRLLNCTMTKNTSSQHYDALFVHPSFSGQVDILNCIIWDNGSGIGVGGNQSQTNVEYSCIDSIEGGLPGDSGNIALDPLFVDTACTSLPVVDIRLSAGSPCIDAAAGGPYDGPYYDHTVIRRAQGRFVDSPLVEDTGSGMPSYLDMGAMEFQACSDCVADFNQDGEVNSLDVFAFLNVWTTGCP